MAEPSVPPCAPSTSPRANHVRTLEWRPLTRRDVVSILACLTVVVAVTIHKLPPGICSGDCGELQLASPTLGITHAPGYPILTSLGYIATCLLPFDPAYTVTLACYAAGLALFMLCALMQMRLGVPTPLAVAVTLCFLWPSRTWINLMAPEVYAPTLLFQAASAYLLLRWESLRRTRDLALAACCFGIALANRTPLGLALPFVLVGWWRARRQGPTRSWETLRSFALVVVCGVAPIVYSIAYLYVRDEPGTPFNYLYLKDTEYDALPPAADGFDAKAERVFFHVAGCEFAYLISHEWKHVRQKFRWLRTEYMHEFPILRGVVLLIILYGGVRVSRRSRSGVWPMLGMMFASIVYILNYRVYGQAADYFPMMWAAFVCFGVGVSPLFTVVAARKNDPPNTPWERLAPTAAAFLRRTLPLFQRHGGTLAFAVVAAITLNETPRRSPPAEYYDATRFLRDLDLATLPRDSVICVLWPETPVVYYAKHILGDRDDIELVGSDAPNWPRVLARFKGRPIFSASAVNHVPGFKLERFRNMKRLVPVQ